MMKKLIALLISLILLCTMAGSALGVTYYDSLSQKLQYQLEKGSGLTGMLQLTADGSGDLVQALQPISGYQWQLRGIRNTDGRFSAEFYLTEGENKQARTTLVGNADTAWLRSDLLIDTLLSFPLKGSLITTLTSVDAATNISWYSALEKLSAVSAEDWDKLLAPYYSQLELWSAGYASEPEVTSGDEELLLTIRYSIPAEAIREELKTLVHMLLADQALLDTLLPAFSSEQSAAYLNPELSWYYDSIIDVLPLSDSLTLSRVMTSAGVIRRTEMVFPLYFGEWKRLTVTQENDELAFLLANDTDSIRLGLRDMKEDKLSGSLTLAQEDVTAFHAAFDITGTKSSSTDEEKRLHEQADWTLRLTELQTAAGTLPDIGMQLRLHWYSKALNDQATTLEVTMLGVQGEDTVTLQAVLRSAVPWEPDEIPEGEAIDMSLLPAEKRSEYISDLFANAMAVLESMRVAEEEPAE